MSNYRMDGIDLEITRITLISALRSTSTDLK